MKKVLMILLALAMVFTMAGVVSAEDSDISYDVGLNYEVSIPADLVVTLVEDGSRYASTSLSPFDVGVETVSVAETCYLSLSVNFANEDAGNLYVVTEKRGVTSKVQYFAGIPDENGMYSDIVDGQEILKIEIDSEELTVPMKFYTTPELTKAARISAKHTDKLTFNYDFIIVPDDSWYGEEGDLILMTAEQLADFAQRVNGGESFTGKTVKLGANIDLAGAQWTPIGTSSNTFQGTFDGQGYTISNLYINQPDKSYVGLFGFTTNGEIKNLIVENAKVTGDLGVGVVAGSPYTSKYSDITVQGHVEVNGFAYVGGVGGRNAYAGWTDITVDVDDTSYVNAYSIDETGAYRTYVGGVIGFMGEGGHKFTNVVSNIDVIGSTIDVGGITGIAHYGNSFINCHSSGDVEITNAAEAAEVEEMGGIAGVWNNGGADVTFDGCSFTGTLNANIVEGVDLSDNTIHGVAYSATGTGNVIVK